MNIDVYPTRKKYSNSNIDKTGSAGVSVIRCVVYRTAAILCAPLFAVATIFAAIVFACGGFTINNYWSRFLAPYLYLLLLKASAPAALDDSVTETNTNEQLGKVEVEDVPEKFKVVDETNFGVSSSSAF